jgi:hypothetical protein|tara:strand:- start:2352 stop:2636 length:285 start_codon:yes stop_codon:yes gene_type:complete
MYRKKTAAEQAKDAHGVAVAAANEHRAVAEVISEAADWGPSGYARLSGLHFANMEDASRRTCEAIRQAEETHVGDQEGMKDKWNHTTYISAYSD